MPPACRSHAAAAAASAEDEEDGERQLVRAQFRIKNPLWWAFFWKEYESKYGDQSKAQVKSAKVSVPDAQRVGTQTADCSLLMLPAVRSVVARTVGVAVLQCSSCACWCAACGERTARGRSNGKDSLHVQRAFPRRARARAAARWIRRALHLHSACG